MDHHKILGGPANVVELGHRGGSIEYAYTWDIWMMEYAYTCCAIMF
jgi:NADH:ubiquinone oxidoreductase subunit B-like Fe-S oxidoreductase